MSLILDALRKMELERKAKHQGSAELRADVLNYRGNPQPPEKSRLLPLVVGLLLFSAAAAFLFYFKGPGSDRAGAIKAVAPVAVITPTLPAVPQAPPVPLAPARTVQPTVVIRASEATDPAGKTAVIKQAVDDNFSISGIAWQEERLLRRAVINGTLLGEGAEISGAKIIEIKENRVRFSRGGSTFEVAYPSGVGK